MRTDAERAHATLDALVDEAYKYALDRGEAITNPEAWKAWKRSVYVATAKREGSGYLRKHYQRLGLGSAYPADKKCAACAQRINGAAVRGDDDDADYCSYQCAGVETMTLSEWLAAHPERAEQMQIFRRRSMEATS